MNVINEIESHALDSDKPILRWLFKHYHLEFEWRFVSKLEWKPYGTQSYQAHRVWSPSPAGIALYEHAHQQKLVRCKECMNWEFGKCKIIGQRTYPNIPNLTDDSAIVIKYASEVRSSNYSSLFTGPDFGCTKGKLR